MITIEVLRIRWEPGKEDPRFSQRLARKKFERWMAGEFIRLVRLTVEEQRASAKWVPLSLAYLAYKREHGLSTLTWKATGELMESLRYFKSSNKIGFPRKRHRDSEDTLTTIARKLEFGDLRVPPRPLFRRVYWYMSKNIAFFKYKYLRVQQGGLV